VPSYHLTVGNLKHGNSQTHLSCGIFDLACFYVMH
jgi:hypothetical protein